MKYNKMQDDALPFWPPFEDGADVGKGPQLSAVGTPRMKYTVDL
jgi:hypothetical protein